VARRPCRGDIRRRLADPHNPPSDDDTLERLLEQVLDLHEQGGMASVERAIESHPAHADALRRHVERLRGLGLLTDDASTSCAAPASFPERLGDFRLIQRLGGGGMGVVYLAEQISLARRVALKLIRPEHLWFDGARDRFKREVEAIARLQHPGIVPVYAAGEDQGVPWMAMEFVGGATLDDAMRELDGARPDRLAGNDLDRTIAKVAHSKDSTSATNATRGAFADDSWTSACARIVRDVARALEHAHRRGVLHRDVKPANIVLTQDGRAQLLDFGLAAAQGASRLTATQSSLGSPAYMSPEQVRGERDLDARTDVYSLGLTLYELLTLHAPFAVDSAEEARKLVLDGATPPMRARNASVPRDLAIVCKKAIAPDRRDRYASAEEFAAARLSPEAVAQVLDARERAKAGPDSPELQAMRRVIKELETARFTIDRDQIHARMGTSVDLLRYRVLNTEGPVITIEAISNSGQKSTLLLTLPEPDLLMFGPPGQEPLVLRRIKR